MQDPFSVSSSVLSPIKVEAKIMSESSSLSSSSSSESEDSEDEKIIDDSEDKNSDDSEAEGGEEKSQPFHFSETPKETAVKTQRPKVEQSDSTNRTKEREKPEEVCCVVGCTRVHSNHTYNERAGTMREGSKDKKMCRTHYIKGLGTCCVKDCNNSATNRNWKQKMSPFFELKEELKSDWKRLKTKVCTEHYAQFTAHEREITQSKHKKALSKKERSKKRRKLESSLEKQIAAGLKDHDFDCSDDGESIYGTAEIKEIYENDYSSGDEFEARPPSTQQHNTSKKRKRRSESPHFERRLANVSHRLDGASQTELEELKNEVRELKAQTTRFYSEIKAELVEQMMAIRADCMDIIRTSNKQAHEREKQAHEREMIQLGLLQTSQGDHTK